MISIVLFGKNDNHGFNYAKRIAISINCLALMLTEAHDEILFIDCDSHDSLPTIIEFIYDTLTEQAKKVLKVLRIRSKDLPTYGKRHFEAIARNAAIRRSCKENRWILSTNTDMVLIPTVEQESLSSLVKDLPEGFYLLPRYAVPENLWNSHCNRLQPQETIQTLKRHSLDLHIEKIISKGSFIGFDNPGDFQLFLREDIFLLQGFEEQMTSGWHVDANLCKRMHLLGRQAQSLQSKLKGYHLNHHLASLRNKIDGSGNSWKTYVCDIQHVTSNTKNWGLADRSLEEISFSDDHLKAILAALAPNERQVYKKHLCPLSFDKLPYAPISALSYVFDLIKNKNKDIRVCYIGQDPTIGSLIDQYLSTMGFLPLRRLNPSKCHETLGKDTADCDIFIFNFGAPLRQEIGQRTHVKNNKRQIDLFFTLTRHISQRNHIPVFIGIDTLHSDFHVLLTRYMHIENADHASSIVYGTFGKKRLLKEPALFIAQYLFTKYFFSHCSLIRKKILSLKVAKYLFKSLHT